MVGYPTDTYDPIHWIWLLELGMDKQIECFHVPKIFLTIRKIFHLQMVSLEIFLIRRKHQYAMQLEYFSLH